MLSIVPAESHTQQRTQVDRLSLLPPELLNIIFHLAHDPCDRQVDPLSRTLLPYVRRNLYVDVELDFLDQAGLFFRTVRDNPALGILVRQLGLDYVMKADPSVPEDWEIIYEIVNECATLDILLPNFASLEAFSRATPPLPAPTLSLYFPFLTVLAYRCKNFGPQETVELSKLQHLVHLEVTFAHCCEPDPPVTDFYPLPRLRKLKLEASEELHSYNPWKPQVAEFIKLCPALSSLGLMDDSRGPRYREFLSSLDNSLKLSLTSLHLFSAPHRDPHPLFVRFECDELLPAFSNLRSLSLGHPVVGLQPGTFLRQLPQLRRLTFGLATHYQGSCSEEIITFLSGPHRISTLEEFVFNSIAGRTGVQAGIGYVEVDKEQSVEERMAEDGWSEPVHRFYDLNLARRILKAGEENGVKVHGSVIELLGIEEARKLEFANRIILRAHQEKSLVEYLAARVQEPNNRLPLLDLDKLNLDNLKLVKVDLPEEKWFQLTLK